MSLAVVLRVSLATDTRLPMRSRQEIYESMPLSQHLFQLSPVELFDYGYHLAYEKEAIANPAVNAFTQWIESEAKISSNTLQV